MFAQSIWSWKFSGLISVEILLLHPFLISRGLAGLSEGGKSLGLGSNRDNLVFKEGWRRPGFGDSPLGDLLCWPVKPIYIPAVPQPSGFLREQLIGFFFLSLSPGNILSCRCLFCHQGPLICCRANSTTQVGLLHWLSTLATDLLNLAWDFVPLNVIPHPLLLFSKASFHSKWHQNSLFCLQSGEFDECLSQIMKEVLNVSGDWTACSANSLQAASFFWY